MAAITLNGNNVDGVEGSWLDAQVSYQDVAGNSSLISWQYGWRFSATSCRGLRNGRVDIDGTTVYNNFASGDGVHVYNSGHNHKPRYQVSSGALWIPHNPDGTRGISLYATLTGWQGLVSTGNLNWTLPTIPRLSSAPSTPVLVSISQTSVYVIFTDGTGGAPIISRQIGYGTNPTAPITTVASDGSDIVTGLNPGTTYYFWARTYNSAGYSPWSPSANTKTIAGARLNVDGTWVDAVPYVNVNGVWTLARPWVRIAGVWKQTL